MRVGFSFHGLLADFEDHRFITVDTPDGHRYGRTMLVKELLARGHEVYILQERRGPLYESVHYPLEDLAWKKGLDEHGHVRFDGTSCEFPALDVIFMEYRWPTWKNDRSHPDHQPSRYEPDLDRQLEILKHYHGKVPIIVWDTDLKITPEFEKQWPEVIIADPSFETNRLTRDRLSIPFWTDFKELILTAEPYPILGYVGNNYERNDEFQKYYFNLKQDARIMGIQISMYGNWLQRSPERQSPESLISNHREVAFNHRMNFYDSMVMMNRFICTTHVSKPRYYETGFMSPRYLEALAVNCPALVPKAFKLNDILGKEWIVEKGSDVRDALGVFKNMTVAQRADVVASQRENLKKVGRFDVKQTADLIESYAHC